MRGEDGCSEQDDSKRERRNCGQRPEAHLNEYGADRCKEDQSDSAGSDRPHLPHFVCRAGVEKRRRQSNERKRPTSQVLNGLERNVSAVTMTNNDDLFVLSAEFAKARLKFFRSPPPGALAVPATPLKRLELSSWNARSYRVPDRAFRIARPPAH